MEIDPVNNQQQDMTKCRDAADICSQAVYHVASLCSAGALMRDLCVSGDQVATDKLARIYKSATGMEKGLALPTCININNIVSYSCPLENDDSSLKAGDLVKMYALDDGAPLISYRRDIAVQIDGYVATCSHTLIVASADVVTQPIFGRSADAICAAYYASELILKALKTGAQSEDFYSIIQQVAEAFHVTPVVGCVVAATKRFVTEDPQKALYVTADIADKNIPFTVGVNESYIVSVKMSSGSGKLKEAPFKCSLFQRNVDTRCNLKMTSARQAFSEITEKHSVFPFTSRNFSVKTRFGMQECLQKDLFTPLFVQQDLVGEYVAEYKFTALVQQNGQTVRITNAGVSLPYVHSDFALPENLAAFFAAPQENVRTVKAKTDAISVGDDRMEE